MGDGGVIVQLKDENATTVAVSDDGWNCLVIHEAPLDKSCESESNPVAGEGVCTFAITAQPEGWSEAGFDDTGWSPATVYTEAEVRPKAGYERIEWDSSARLIWGPDLETNNTVLCRLTVS